MHRHWFDFQPYAAGNDETKLRSVVLMGANVTTVCVSGRFNEEIGIAALPWRVPREAAYRFRVTRNEARLLT